MTQASKTKSTSATSNAKTDSDTHPISDKMKDVLHESVDAMSQRTAATEEALRETAQSGSQNFAAKQAELEGRWESSSIRQYAVENPIATAGIVFAAGMLVSSLMKKTK